MWALHGDLNTYVWPYLDVSPLFSDFSGDAKARLRAGWLGRFSMRVMASPREGPAAWVCGDILLQQQRRIRPCTSKRAPDAAATGPRVRRTQKRHPRTPAPRPQVLYMSGAALCAGWVLLIVFNSAWLLSVLPVDVNMDEASGKRRNDGGPITGAIGGDHVQVNVRN